MAKNSKNCGEWLAKAKNDMKSAVAILGYYESDIPTDMACYHCHQTAEKSFKALLAWKGLIIPNVHDLVTLFNISLKHAPGIESLRNNAKKLNRYYIEAKYPLDAGVQYSIKEAKSALEYAQGIMQATVDLING